jgi:hypothetical protein
MTFAYTGHADIGGHDTAEFFQGRMAASLGVGRSLEEGLREVGAMCSDYFRSLRPETDRHHAFVGVGWEVAASGRTPFLICESNAMSETGDWLRQPRERFRAYRRALDPLGDPYTLLVAGAEMSDTALGYLHAQLGSLTSESHEPGPVARILIETVRAEADQSDAIGKGVMVNCIPISPGPPTREIHLIAGQPSLDTRTFTYVPTGSFEGRWLGPLVVTADGQQLGDFEAIVGDPDTPGVGMIYGPASAGPIRRVAVGQRVRDDRLGRNDPCWCGSGVKYKKCHGA